jgi:hypothetical protein
MISFKLRNIFYSAAAGAKEVNRAKNKELAKITEIETQLTLAKKIMNDIELKNENDPVVLIRIEGKIKKLEKIIKQKKNGILNY